MPDASREWLHQLRNLHDEASRYDWRSHLEMLNLRYALTGRKALGTAVEGVAPAWFNGDVERLVPGEWTLVISLNPAQAPPGHYRGELTSETAWDFWRNHNLRFWYSRFFRPLVRVSSQAVGKPIPTAGFEERDFATSSMVFVELCPYASGEFGLDPAHISELSTSDYGFKVADQVRRLLVDDALPALVLVNGLPAVSAFEDVESPRLSWELIRYSSPEINMKTGLHKQLRHWEGTLETGKRRIPVAGFPFLRKPHCHNSNSELDLLATMIRERSVTGKK